MDQACGGATIVTDSKIEAVKAKARDAFVRMPLPGMKYPSELADAVVEAIVAALREFTGLGDREEAEP